MALTPEQTTRIDQLAADLRHVAAATAARTAVPSTLPLFVRHDDGSVWDRQGHLIYTPPSAGRTGA